MNRNKLKAYAPQARRDFIKAVTDRAAFYGLTKEKIEPISEQGDVAIIGGKPFPIGVAKKRKWLEERIRRDGFEQVMEAMAYTWFNRFAAIRFMEIHGYLDHGYRVLSHPEGYTIPEIVEHAEHINLPGLDKEKAVELKLEGTKEAELYRMLLMGQCNALHKAMPFLFEKIGDATELLLPENLLHSDSLIRRMVNEIPEEEWEEVEIIGWLYQFYISEKKDQVIGKVVKSEDIPAATQLFTPNWIVKYMVQNSLGAQWLATYPHSPLKKLMEYYIEPADQTPEVEEQLKAITPDTLNPEELTLADVACGSGHILVEGYDLFKAIYQERGYRAKDIPRLILEKNLYGLDIDDRAVQLAAFALMMKAREDDRRIFERGVKLNVMALVDSAGFDAEGLTKGVELGDYGLESRDLTELKRLFEHATTFGSLIQVPERLEKKLPALKQLSEATSQDLFVSEALERLRPLVRQAELLAAQYDAVVTNPPYMGAKGMTAQVKSFLMTNFPDGQKDLFAAFILRASQWLITEASTAGLVTPFTWMNLSSFEKLRAKLFAHSTLSSLVELETNAFEPAMVTVCSFVFSARQIADYSGCYIRLSNFKGAKNQAPRTLEAIRNRECGWFYIAKADDFKKMPGDPVVYWASTKIYSAFEYTDGFMPVGRIGTPRKGMATGDNERFVRVWSEVDLSKSPLDGADAPKWFPYNNGGKYRKWYGNIDRLINWEDDGYAIRNFKDSEGRLRSRPQGLDQKFREMISWTSISSTSLGVRFYPEGFISDQNGNFLVADDEKSLRLVLAFMCSSLAGILIKMLNPTMHILVSNVHDLPLPTSGEIGPTITRHARQCIDHAKADWDSFEKSWHFQSLPLLTVSSDPTPTLESSYTTWITQNRDTIAEMKRLEEENNRLFIDAYGLADELTPDVPIEQITLTINPAYRYGGKLTEEEQWTRFRQDTMEELVSYAIGCMMGRYSLDVPGLIYAHSGNEGFDQAKYPTFPADADGIVPLTDTEWFDDDACHRIIKFISVAWDASHLKDNLTFLADNLSPKKAEVSRETIRRYLCDKFFKEHLKTYKKRPIYWLFSSGKLRAFQCLVYLHRYNEGTLARMRTEYVIPLQGKIAARIDQLTGDINAATSTAHRKKLEREKDKLVKQQTELQVFDEKLRHYADQRISLDLDDGVKVNYGKFGDLLAEVKAVTGKKRPR